MVMLMFIVPQLIVALLKNDGKLCVDIVTEDSLSFTCELMNDEEEEDVCGSDIFVSKAVKGTIGEAKDWRYQEFC